MTWRNFGKALALALIGQAVVRIALTDAIGTPVTCFGPPLHWSSFLVLIGFILDVIASIQQASAEQNLP